MNESCHTYEQVMSHIWMSHVTHLYESCHTYERVLSHIWMSHVTHMNESCHTCKWVMSHIWTSHGTLMNESWHTYMNEARHTYEWVTSHIWMRYVKKHELDVHCVTWLVHMTRSYVWHEWDMSECTNQLCIPYVDEACYGVATVSRIDKITGLFCRISSLL